MKKLNISVLALFLVLASSSSNAGLKLNYGDITISDYYFMGSMGATRNSSNRTSIISTFEQRGVAGFTVRDQNDVTKRCTTSAPDLVDRIRNINNDAFIIVYYNDGECTSMIIYTHTAYAPKS